MRRSLLIIILGVFSMVASGQDNDIVYDHVMLQVSAQQDVENDLLIASVYAEHQASTQREVAADVNEAIQWALEMAKATADVKVQTTQYNTYPIYEKHNRIVGWRARQALRLESQDAEALSELIGKLQDKLAVESISYDVSNDARERAEERLIREALAKFRNRALLVAQQLQREGYRIVHMSVNSQGRRPAPVTYRGRAMAAEVAMDDPAVEAGTQALTVSVDGTIELDPVR